jgi:hypothetical protein
LGDRGSLGRDSQRRGLGGRFAAAMAPSIAATLRAA